MARSPSWPTVTHDLYEPPLLTCPVPTHGATKPRLLLNESVAAAGVAEHSNRRLVGNTCVYIHEGQLCGSRGDSLKGRGGGSVWPEEPSCRVKQINFKQNKRVGVHTPTNIRSLNSFAHTLRHLRVVFRSFERRPDRSRSSVCSVCSRRSERPGSTRFLSPP